MADIHRSPSKGSQDGITPMGSKDVGPGQSKGRANRRRSSLSMEAGVSIAQREQEALSTRGKYVSEVVEPILLSLATKFHEEDTGVSTTSWDDVVKGFINFVQTDVGAQTAWVPKGGDEGAEGADDKGEKGTGTEEVELVATKVPLPPPVEASFTAPTAANGGLDNKKALLTQCEELRGKLKEMGEAICVWLCLLAGGSPEAHI